MESTFYLGNCVKLEVNEKFEENDVITYTHNLKSNLFHVNMGINDTAFLLDHLNLAWNHIELFRSCSPYHPLSFVIQVNTKQGAEKIRDVVLDYVQRKDQRPGYVYIV